MDWQCQSILRLMVFRHIGRRDQDHRFLQQAKFGNRTGACTGDNQIGRQNIHTGRYAIRPNDNVYHVYSRFSRGYQEPMNLTIGSVRTLDRLTRSIGKQLMIDSAEIASQLFDSTFLAQMGYTNITLPSLFIPETYQVYWDMSVRCV